MISITAAIRSALERRRRHDPVTDYLNDAVSITDLERRQREVEHGRFRPQRFPY